MAAVLLSLASSLAWGFGDFFGGMATRRTALLAVMVGSQAAGVVAIAAVLALRGEPFPGTDVLPWVGVSALFGLAGLSALYQGLAVGPMSVVAPIAATAAVIPVVVGAARGEVPTTVQNGGIALALGGVVLASRTPRGPGSARPLAAGAGLGVLAAVFIGSYLVVFDAASEEDPYWAALLARVGATLVLAALALARRPSFRLGPRTLALVALIGVLDAAGNTLFAVASTKGLVGVVAVLSSLYPVVTVALARIVLGERLTGGQATGVALAFAGVGLLATG